MRLLRSAISVFMVPAIAVLILFGIFSRSADGSSSNNIDHVIPWERQYKIKPNQKARLTAADVIGPDGIVYPNWTKCGVAGFRK